MRKNSLLVLTVTVFMILFSVVSSYASNASDYADYEKMRQVWGVAENEQIAEPAEADASRAESATGDIVLNDAEGEDCAAVSKASVTRDSGPILYYCVVPKDKIANFEAFCKKHDAPIMIYRAFNQLIFLQKLGVIVTTDKAKQHFISQLRKNYKAKVLKNVALKVKIHVFSVTHFVNIKKEDFITGDFGGCDAVLSAMLKNPYGNNSTMLKTIGRNFPGLLDKVTVKAKEWWGFGKKRKILFNPSVTVEMQALNMNGRNKNVTLFHKQFNFKTIKHAENYNWSK